MIRVALLSKWHVHADDYAKQALRHPDISIQAVWDEDTERGARWADELGVPFYDELETVLSDPNIDAVIVDTPTNRHKDIILSAAKYRKHIFTEKVLAFTVADCDEIASAVKDANVQLMVSLPRLTETYYLYAQDAIDRGWLGTLTSIRCRLAHNGAVPTDNNPDGWLPGHFFDKEACGGGAFIDLGAHPIYLTNRLAGAATGVTARLQKIQGREVDDNAIALVEYESGALGTLETGFLSGGSPFQLELYGTEGTLLIEDEQIRIKSRHFEEGGWVKPESLPNSLPMPLEQWAAAIKEGVKPTITFDDARGLTLINEAAVRSHQEGKKVDINEIIGGKQPWKAL